MFHSINKTNEILIYNQRFIRTEYTNNNSCQKFRLFSTFLHNTTLCRALIFFTLDRLRHVFSKNFRLLRADLRRTTFASNYSKNSCGTANQYSQQLNGFSHFLKRIISYAAFKCYN